MDDFDAIFSGATKNVSSNYFLLQRYEDSDVLRERHYCYELYHQMRISWPKETRLILSGEVDKRSHGFIKELVGSSPIPDFLVHEPGSMNNELIIEVKTENYKYNGVAKDFINLSLFIKLASYKRAVFLVFGDNLTPYDMAYIEDIYRDLINRGHDLQPIEVWVHSQCDEPAEPYQTLSV